ncbi:MAG: Cell division-specific peptidoglycan biosynthesis regulator FtsW [Parcubacteria group bacterium GW2011_GWA2_31_28]|nr:MAG: Cell division-specific peptidoglycan biosynthesis regulator FtsW [Parcubacteria group bacterium GW2011_GWA2_31_28]
MHRIFVITILTLTIFGLLMVASSSFNASQQVFGTPYYFFIKQLAIGLFGLFLFFSIDRFFSVKFLKKMALISFFIVFLLLLAVFIPWLNFAYGGSTRWIDLGFITFQPSELTKIGLILFSSAWLATRKKDVKSLFKTFIPYLVIIGIPLVLILLQKDISTFFITSITLFVMIFLAGTKIRYLGGVGILIVILVVIAIFVFPTRMDRMRVFLDKEIDPQGISYQVNQSLIAIGSGGITGKGLGMSNQKFSFLPEPSGDSIFAVIAEELGFIGTLIVVFVYLILFIEGIIIARNASDFSKLFIYGFITLVIIQAFINISSVTGLIPFTGVTLPFISYGGTSLIALLVGAGVVARIAREQ